jgi:hypothetical protein
MYSRVWTKRLPKKFSSHEDTYVFATSDRTRDKTISPEDTLSVACHLVGIEGDDSLGDIADSKIRSHDLHEEEEHVVKYRG